MKVMRNMRLERLNIGDSETRNKRLQARCMNYLKRKNTERALMKEKRLQKCREYKQQKRANESDEHRQNRLQVQQANNINRRANESGEQRQSRLQAKQANNINRRANESKEHKQNRLSKQQECDRKRKKCDAVSISDLIHRFHIALSKAPVYICTCCDQLWYRHSVNSAFAVKNGMVFPEKPESFDLNQLEWRLIAPRLAFLKLMQAPRGKQFKINGNVVNVPADVVNTVNTLPTGASLLRGVGV